MNTDKKGARYLTEILKKKGVKHVILCPGSRNAPLIISFTSDPHFKTYTIVDERSASFFALGICQRIKDTVAIVCTSGSALLNIGPAVAEAYYQRLPLLVISADRPLEWVNQGESQTMDQDSIFRNFVRASYDLVQEPNDMADVWFHNRQVNEAINKTRKPYWGPVHLNIRFREPLYQLQDSALVEEQALNETEVQTKLTDQALQSLKERWSKYQRIAIICGLYLPNGELKDILNQLSDAGVVVLTETTSNLPGKQFFPCIDRIVMPLTEDEKEKLSPELLISIGGPLITRRIKTYLREEGIKENWRVDPLEPYQDAFMKQTEAVAMEAADFLQNFTSITPRNNDYRNEWNKIEKRREDSHAGYLKKCTFSDLKVFAFLQAQLPEKCHVHVANSSAIRYMQLFRQKPDQKHYCNRGTSGIEGSISSAVGFNQAGEGLTFVITGDLSMMYDSNALWNNYLGPSLKIIIINNGGGGIFRIIPGPSDIDGFEEFIEARHEMNFKDLAQWQQLSYFMARNEEDLREVWKNFIEETEKAAILEIDTKGIANENILKDYFNHLGKSSVTNG